MPGGILQSFRGFDAIVNALAMGMLVTLVLLVLFSPRRWALLAMMAGVLYLPAVAGVAVMGVNFSPMRFLELAGFVRVTMRKEFPPNGLNGVDKAFILAYVYTTAVFLLRSSLGYGTSSAVSQVGTMDRLGSMVDAGLCYLTFRALIGSMEDLMRFLKDFALLLIPFVALLLAERGTGQNPFALVGGVPAFYDLKRVRCVGSFTHPSLLGTLGASFLPLFIGLALTKKCRTRAFAGIGLCAGVVLFSNSGGPVSFALLTLIAWIMWAARERMRLVRSGIVILLVLLGVFMESPLCYLPGKMSLVFGGDGWHRSRLMEVAFENVSEWWLAGMPLDLTRSWFPYLVGGSVDITNAYLGLGLDAGIVGIVLFVLLLVRAFRMLGCALAVVRLTPGRPTDEEFLLWGLGAMLVGHISNWFAITYFDQTKAVWFMQIAAIASVTATFGKSALVDSSNRFRSLLGSRGATAPSSQYCGARARGTTT